MSDFEALHVRALDDLPSAALGEPVDDDELALHIDSCERCRHELDAYRHVAAVARDIGALSPLVEPPPSVWSRIAAARTDVPQVAGGSDAAQTPSTAEVEPMPPAPAVRPVAGRPGRGRAMTARWPVGLAAAVVAVLAAAAIGWAAGRSSSPSMPPRTEAAALQAQPGTAVGAHGTATMHATSGGFVMDVRTSGLPVRDGFYEVWLYDPSASKMVPIGLLGSGGRGSFTVPGGLDVAAYHVVDVSIQRYDGDPQHGTSALRGALTR